MSLIADTHLHLYPFYSLATGIGKLVSNLNRLASDASPAGFLAERYDCCFFDDLLAGRALIEDGVWKVVPGREPEVLELRREGAAPVFLYAGRQLVTAERIEILALTTRQPLPDGLSAREAVERILAVNAVPVLSWAPGKWLGKRGSIVKDLIDHFDPGQLLIGDTTLRPTIWPEPDLMRRAAEKGLAIMAGSDPLPFAGEERRMGTYATRLDVAADSANPVRDVRSALRTLRPTAPRLGSRGSAISVFARLLRHAIG
jgi:hypothetical protein